MPKITSTETKRTYFITGWTYAVCIGSLALLCIADWIYTASQGKDTYAVGYFSAILLLLLFPVPFIPSTRTVDIKAREVMEVTGRSLFRTVVRRPLANAKEIRVTTGRVGEGSSGQAYYVDMEFKDSSVTRFGAYFDQRKASEEAGILSAFCGIPIAEKT